MNTESPYVRLSPKNIIKGLGKITDPIKRARMLHALKSGENADGIRYTTAQIAKETRCNILTVQRDLRLLALPDEIQKHIGCGNLQSEAVGVIFEGLRHYGQGLNLTELAKRMKGRKVHGRADEIRRQIVRVVRANENVEFDPFSPLPEEMVDLPFGPEFDIYRVDEPIYADALGGIFGSYAVKIAKTSELFRETLSKAFRRHDSDIPVLLAPRNGVALPSVVPEEAINLVRAALA